MIKINKIDVKRYLRDDKNHIQMVETNKGELYPIHMIELVSFSDVSRKIVTEMQMGLN